MKTKKLSIYATTALVLTTGCSIKSADALLDVAFSDQKKATTGAASESIEITDDSKMLVYGSKKPVSKTSGMEIYLSSSAGDTMTAPQLPLQTPKLTRKSKTTGSETNGSESPHVSPYVSKRNSPTGISSESKNKAAATATLDPSKEKVGFKITTAAAAALAALKSAATSTDNDITPTASPIRKPEYSPFNFNTSTPHHD